MPFSQRILFNRSTNPSESSFQALFIKKREIQENKGGCFCVSGADQVRFFSVMVPVVEEFINNNCCYR